MIVLPVLSMSNNDHVDAAEETAVAGSVFERPPIPRQLVVRNHAGGNSSGAHSVELPSQVLAVLGAQLQTAQHIGYDLEVSCHQVAVSRRLRGLAFGQSCLS